MIGAQSGARHYQYRYDALGNRTARITIDAQGTQTETYRYPEPGQGNRLLSRTTETGTETLDYNAAGSAIQSNGLSTTYNAEQRPIAIHRDGQLIARYHYNRFGERIKKVVHSANGAPKTTYYLYDGQQLTAEADEAGQITAQYLYLHNQPVAKLEQCSLE